MCTIDTVVYFLSLSVRLSVCSAVSSAVSISSNYTNTDFNLKLFINGNEQERMIIKELLRDP